MTVAAPSAYDVAKQIEGWVRTVYELGQRVYLGRVPGTVPTTADGYVYVYAAIWPGTGVMVDDSDISGIPDISGQRFDFTTTIVGADVDSVLKATDRVKSAITGKPVGNGVIWPNIPRQEGAAVIEDTNERPARFYIPLAWYVQTQ